MRYICTRWRAQSSVITARPQPSASLPPAGGVNHMLARAVYACARPDDAGGGKTGLNMLRTAFALLVLIAPVAAQASGDVHTKASIFVERIDSRANGGRRIRLEPARQVSSGERLIYIVEYRNTGKRPVQDFTVTNPLPRTVRLDETMDGSELVSIDGGRSWGQLSALRVSLGDAGWRPANPQDVTHLRWRVGNRLMQGETRRVTFRAIVR